LDGFEGFGFEHALDFGGGALGQTLVEQRGSAVLGHVASDLGCATFVAGSHQRDDVLDHGFASISARSWGAGERRCERDDRAKRAGNLAHDAAIIARRIEMEFEDTSGSGPERSSGPEPSVSGSLETETVRPDGSRGIETRRQKALIAAALFDETPTPIKIGRFTIVRELGAGGMGVVYVAYDEQLDRRVAVKLLRGSDTDAEAQLRLQREAQAMARVSHPNVVTVHEVGTFQDQVFVAMEFVDGQDLRGWQKAERHDWRTIVAIFAQAGEGLAAAHDAGLVHRDFKPDNVLVGKDGRVRVADFGLAHAFDAAVVERVVENLNTGDDEPTSRLESSLTKTGTIMGTPAYMAPEQFEGSRSDARSDQFSFCVALWEGLYGRRPFSGENLVALSYAVMAGNLDPAPTDVGVPAWLHALLVRGLAPMAEDRWPSMRALLDALANDPEIRRTRVLRLATLASVTATVLAGLMWLAGTSIAQNARQHYWSGLTEQLLELERERGFRQASDDAQRARDATRMSVYRSYRPKGGVVDHEDPTVAAVLLREVEGSARASEAWVSAANEILGRPISKAVLTGHRDSIEALVFAPDGKVLYSASVDGTVRRWDLSTGIGETIITHAKEVTGIAVSPDGRTVLSSSKDGTARAWSEGRVRVIAEHEGEVMSVAFSREGRRVVTTSKDGTARVVDLESGEGSILRGHDGPVYSASFDASGQRVLTVSGDRTARVWNADDGRTLAILRGHEDAVFHCRFLEDGRLVTASDDGTVRRWQLGGDGSAAEAILVRHRAAVTALDVHGIRVVSSAADGDVQIASIEGQGMALSGHTDGVWAAKFTPDGSSVVTASFDATARMQRADGSGVDQVFEGHRVSLFRLALDSTGEWLATGSYDGSIRLWALARPRLEIPLEGHTRAVFRVDVDGSGQRIVTASRDGTARVWSMEDGSNLAVLAGSNESLNTAIFSPDGERVATGTKLGVVESWQVSTGTLTLLVGHDDAVWSLAFDPEGRRLASASFDGTARIWDVGSGQELLVLRGHEGKVVGVDFEPSGERVVTASHDRTLRIWDAQTGALAVVLAGHEGRVSAFARSPDGKTLATASDDSTARLWPDDDSAHALVLRGHAKPIWSVSFDPEGTRVITASFDGTARVWNTSDGSVLATLEGHAAGLWDARFTADGRAVTVSDDNTVRIWTLDSDRPPIVLSGHHNGITGLALSPDGTRIISGSADSTAKVWRLDLLTSESQTLYEQLLSATTYCLTAEQRVRELGDDWRHAEAAVAACEQTGTN
jgi:WD40 repeat protein/serine/threonine protein kinase